MFPARDPRSAARAPALTQELLMAWCTVLRKPVRRLTVLHACYTCHQYSETSL